ncbi:MAG: TatD family hydrolase [Actinomycetota bacterium]|jgi:TatD DNase family protein|nr:TatD family hydrolase [Actinomycetota bacterium]
MSELPPLDLHAHVDPAISSEELELLGAVVFAVTRSLSEGQQALKRRDRATIWGVGCHPGVVKAQQSFRPETFAELLEQTPFVGELGLDGNSRVPLSVQMATLREALQILTTNPRIVSLHSHAATKELLELLEATPIRGIVLHWWLGDPLQTKRAINLGCYFSVNAALVRHPDRLERIPIDRLLTETDHPFGDHRGQPPHRPGRVEDVEAAIGRLQGSSPRETRIRLWQNLGGLVREVGCSTLLPRTVRSRLASVMPSSGAT